MYEILFDGGTYRTATLIDALELAEYLRETNPSYKELDIYDNLGNQLDDFTGNIINE